MKHQILIASYKKDFEWLQYCLASLNKFAVGWLPPVICVTSEDEAGAKEIVAKNCPSALVVVKDGRPGQGFMRAQLAMMNGDLLCPEADNIYFVGSDCLAYDVLRPEPYCDSRGRPGVLYTELDTMEQHIAEAMHWVKGTEFILGFRPPAEYMRRIPSVFPRSIFAPMRAYVEKLHNKEFEDLIYDYDAKCHDVSEANILGAFADKLMPETCCWINTDDPVRVEAKSHGWPNAIMHMWSWGGLDRPMQGPETANYVLPDGTNTLGITPRAIIAKILG